MIIINGTSVRELRCKNDSCRYLICYERFTAGAVGIIIFVCPKCEQTSEFRFNYSKAQGDIDKLRDITSGEGGEILNGGYK